MKLRDYQVTPVDNLRDSYRRGRRAPLLVAPTAFGKTVVSAHIIQSATALGNRALFVAPRRELIGQTVRKLADAGVWDVRVIQAKNDVGRPDAPVIVGSIQTLTLPRWLGRLPAADLVIADEAHHMVSDQWSKLAGAYPSARWLGLTATPERADGKPLGDIFDDLIVAASVAELMELHDADPTQGLVRCRVFGPPRGELESGELALDPVAAYQQHGGGELAVVFCVTVEHAERVTAEFLAAGIPSAVVSGNMPAADRASILTRWANGDIRVVANCGVLCLDDKTEILTSSGWTGIDEMTDDHLVGNWDNGRVTFEKPLQVVRRMRHDGESMVSLESDQASVRVTGTHRMLYRTTRGGRFLKCPALDLVGRHVQIPVSGKSDAMPVTVESPTPHKNGRSRAIAANVYNLINREGMSRDAARAEATRRVDRRASLGSKNPQDLTIDECHLIGFWLGDGSVNHLKRGGVEYTLSQSKVYPKIISWLDDVLDRTGIHHVRREKNYSVDHVRWSMPRGTGGGSQERPGVRPLEPYLNKAGSNLLWGLNEDQFDAFVHGLWMADGDHRKGDPVPDGRSMLIYSVNREMLSLIQAIASVRGYGTHLYESSAPKKENHRQLWRLRLKKAAALCVAKKTFTEELVWVPERVWCVETRTKNIITRRNGTVVVMGNTEGFDLPALGVCILARRFGHAGLYLQCVGRVLRPSPGKTRATVIDLCGSSIKHGPPDMPREYSLTGKAIRPGAGRDVIRQCPNCAAVFLAGPLQCPQCGAELPSRQAEIPRSTGIGVVDLSTIPAPPTRTYTLSITAKFPGQCRSCGGGILPGDQIWWARGEKPRHVECRREVTA